MAAERPFLVGQAPSSTSDPGRPFSGRSGMRIAELMGLDVEREDWYELLRETFEPLNLLPDYLGKRERGDVFTMSIGRTMARALIEEFAGSRWVLVGAKVCRCFDVDAGRAPRCQWIDLAPRRVGHVAMLPHPSGLNLWYNEPANVERARAFLTEEVERVRWLRDLPRAP